MYESDLEIANLEDTWRGLTQAVALISSPALLSHLFTEIVHHYLHFCQVLQKSDIVKLHAKNLLVEDERLFFKNARTKLKRDCLPNMSIHTV